jgi:phage terminase small subunit
MGSGGLIFGDRGTEPAHGQCCTHGAPVRNRFLQRIFEGKKLKRPKVTAPNHLRKETKAWFLNVLQEFELEEHHVKLLTLAAESWDRATLAREAIAEHGLTYTDRFSSPRKRPEVSIAESATIAFARLTRELDLDVDPPATHSRPPALRSNRRD